MSHKEKMTARRIRQLARLPGFTPMYNSAMGSKMERLTSTFILQGKPENVAQTLAAQQVRAGLPNPAFVRTRPFHGRSKYPLAASA
jgi:hypothetical protein